MNIFSLNWWASTLVSALIMMAFFYIIKKVTAKVNIPVVSTIAQEV